ncbi:hypothetical protein N7495_006609 [Penicillium taxi]|uniref:uncharacterized protein n=1 Tax=Penicillium taxi TaxID=168475 RepID=UPI002545A64C|nr:uncharacterized protein N7495_006609 [Penicillium taxi]KAJ5894918.1 hypothetical protein N7495_006609 [Penicillium taxi]
MGSVPAMINSCSRNFAPHPHLHTKYILRTEYIIIQYCGHPLQVHISCSRSQPLSSRTKSQLSAVGSFVIMRNVIILHGITGENLGAFDQRGSIIKKVFFDMLDIILEKTAPTVFEATTGAQLHPTRQILDHGTYSVFPTSGEVLLTREVSFRRLPSRNNTPIEEAFQVGLRIRDGKCMISLKVNPMVGDPGDSEEWDIFEGDFSWFITTTNTNNHRADMNSIQNGLLLKGDVHKLFDKFIIIVNPDDNYRVIDFKGDREEVDGNILDPACRVPSDPDRVADGLLRWHFRQAVLAHMKAGAGVPVWETDFPPPPPPKGRISSAKFCPAQWVENEWKQSCSKDFTTL